MFDKKQTVVKSQPKYRYFQEMFHKPLNRSPYIDKDVLVFSYSDGTDFIMDSEIVNENVPIHSGAVWITPDYKYIHFVNEEKQERRVNVENMIILSRLGV